MMTISLAMTAQTVPQNSRLAITKNTKNNDATRVIVQDTITKELQWVLKSSIGGSSNALDKTSSPQVKSGGLTLGTNFTKPNDNWITLGTSVTNSAVYSTPTALQLNLTLLNYGVSGSTSNDLVNHYSQIPTLNSGNQDQYRLLSIEHGINDSAQNVGLITFRANLLACIANAKGKNWPNNKILIISGNYCTNAPMITTLESYANEAMAIAKEQGVQYYDAYNYTKNNGAGALLTDGVHPSTAGGLVYARGLIASMNGGMEITNGLTVVNGITAGGPLNVDKGIITLGSIKTGNGIGNNPANTVNGDVIVPFNAGLISQYSQTGIISKFTPLEEVSGSFQSTFRNYTEGGGHSFFTSGGTRGSQILRLKINDNGIIDTPSGINSAENIAIGFNKDIKSVAAWTNKLTISEASGSTGISNGYASGDINFYTANGVTNASNLAFKVLSNKSVRTYSDLQVDGNLNLGFDKYLQYSGAYVNKIYASSSGGEIVVSNGYSGGTINFNTSNGVTNAVVPALKILTNGTSDFYKTINSREDINIEAGKKIQYLGAWNSKLVLVDGGSFSTSIYNGYSSGVIDFYTSNGITNAANLAFRILNNKNIRAYADLQVDGNTTHTGTTTFTGTVSGITKSMVGLSNVDNTTDVGKPVSTATQTALDLKSNLSSPNFTGTPTAPTAATSTNTTQIATTAFVQTEISTNTVGKVTTPDVTIASGATVALITLASNASYLGHITYLSDKTRFKSVIFGVGQEGGTTQGALSIINDPAGAQFSISMSGGIVSVTNASGASQTFRIVLSKIGF